MRQTQGLCVQVRYLKIIEKSGYQALPWVRYITQNGGERLPAGQDLHRSFWAGLPVWS